MMAGSSNFYRDLLDGIMRYCGGSGRWEFMIEREIFNPQAIERIRLAIRHWRLAGLITSVWTPPLRRAVAKLHVPTVELSGAYGNEGFARVHADDEAIGRLAGRHLIERGLRSFAYWGTPKHVPSVRRFEGLRQEVSRLGVEPTFICRGIRTHHGRNVFAEHAVATEFLAKQSAPLGVLCFNDYWAWDLMAVCDQIGLNVPQNVAVVGIGNDEAICTVSRVPISSVETSGSQIGYEAMRILGQMIRGQATPAKAVLVSPLRVLGRRSSDILLAPDNDISRALHFVREHAGEPIGVRDILAEVPMARRRLERRFRELLGRTPEQHLFHERVERAKGLLLETNLNLADVAARSGFANASIFAAIFKRAAGMTPRQYRLRHARPSTASP